MDFQIGLVIAGLVVGFIVGLTGVGGGSLMTPILLYFNIPPTTAVGTDLLYAAFTKAGVYLYTTKRKHQLENHRLAYSWQCSCFFNNFMDFKQYQNRY